MDVWTQCTFCDRLYRFSHGDVDTHEPPVLHAARVLHTARIGIFDPTPTSPTPQPPHPTPQQATTHPSHNLHFFRASDFFLRPCVRQVHNWRLPCARGGGGGARGKMFRRERFATWRYDDCFLLTVCSTECHVCFCTAHTYPVHIYPAITAHRERRVGATRAPRNQVMNDVCLCQQVAYMLAPPQH